jgi:hypothetical protein
MGSHRTGVLDTFELLALEASEPRDKAAGIVGRLAYDRSVSSIESIEGVLYPRKTQ